MKDQTHENKMVTGTRFRERWGLKRKILLSKHARKSVTYNGK
jgi:hypothetical protein